MTYINIYKFIPGIAWFFILLVLLCMPGNEFPAISWSDKIFLDKWVHMGFFGLLAFFFMLPVALSPMEDKDKLHYFIRIAIATSVWGLTTEFIQKYFVAGRSFDLLDWASDSIGAFITYMYCRKKFV